MSIHSSIALAYPNPTAMRRYNGLKDILAEIVAKSAPNFGASVQFGSLPGD
jgi:hypothetical protein